MQNNNASQYSDHAHLVQKLSAIIVQINALQALVRDENLACPGESEPALANSVTTLLQTLHDGLATLEQATREALQETRAFDEETPLTELMGVTLTEALSRAIEEAAETLGLSSRITFSGEERALPGYVESLLYRIAREALYHIQQHTGSRRLRLVFTYGHDEVQMSIEGDGSPVSVFESSDLTRSVDAQRGWSDAFQGEEDASVPPFVFDAPVVTDTVLSDLRHRLEHLGGSLEIFKSSGLTEGSAKQRWPDAFQGVASTEEGFHVRARVPNVVAPRFIEGSPSASATSTSVDPTDAESTQLDTGSTQSSALPEHVRVLVVEAQAVTRAGLRRLLESYPDLEVVGEAADGVQAVSETLELGPQVVLMDMQLPNGQSLEALRQIKQLNLNTRVLLLSALDREEYLYETLRAGAGGYVLKDIAPDELAQAVRTVARGEVPVQPQLARRLLSQFSRQARGNHPYDSLTAREQEVLRLLARGLRNKEMAARLHVSERTINFHLANIYQKLNVSGRTEALSKALEQGLITA